MAALLTWERYSSLHSKVNADEFEVAEARAENEIRTVIGPLKWATITSDTPFYDVLLDCIANVIDRSKDLENSAMGKGVTSVSNDGYSESYAIANAIDLDYETRSCITQWLSGTGMVGAY